jgi:multicomponent Na+:H+ antiporter subunit G
VNPLAAILVLLGAVTILIAGVGLLRFRSPYARFHAAGKASPVAFLLIAMGAATEVDAASAARLAVAAVALVVTLPVGVHQLFRAVHRSQPSTLDTDELADAEQRDSGSDGS